MKAESWDEMLHDAPFGDEARWRLAAALSKMDLDVRELVRERNRMDGEIASLKKAIAKLEGREF